MGRMGWTGRSLGAVMMIGLTLVGCTTQRGVVASSGPPTDAAGPVEVARRCEDFTKGFRYAEKSVGGRVVLTALLTPLMVGVGLAGTMTGDLRGLALAAGGPVAMGQWTAKASQDNQTQREHLRQACEEGGGPDTVVAARAVRDLAQVREGERSNQDAVRLYRDTLGILDRAGAGESEDAVTTALCLASLVEKTTPADPEIGPLYERAVRIRESQGHAQPRELASLLIKHGRWLRATGRPSEAEAVDARADALNREANAVEAAARASSLADGRASSTGIVVAESCAPATVNALDQLNQDAAVQGGAGRVVAVDCDAAGQISAVRLTTPAGVSDALTLSHEEADPRDRIRAALFTTEP